MKITKTATKRESFRNEGTIIAKNSVTRNESGDPRITNSNKPNSNSGSPIVGRKKNK